MRGCAVDNKRSNRGLHYNGWSAHKSSYPVLCNNLPVLIAKSKIYTHKTAITIMEFFTNADSGSAPNTPKKPPTMSLVQARNINDMMVAAAPPSMNGLRLPQLRRQLSLSMPTYGCTNVPDNGPAIQTSAINDLLRPSESR